MEIYGGVPQEPELRNLLYNGLFEVELPRETTTVGFADGGAVVVTAKTEEELMNNANYALRGVDVWMQSKHLQLSPDKSEVVLLTHKRKLKCIQFDLNGILIKSKTTTKYLGVWID